MSGLETRVGRLGGRRKKAEHGAVIVYRFPGREPTDAELEAHFPGVADDFVFIMLPSKDKKMHDDGNVIVGSGEASFDNGVWLE